MSMRMSCWARSICGRWAICRRRSRARCCKLAIAEYEKLAQLKPNDVETHLLLGQLYGLNHDSAKAEAQFKAAQKIDANSEEVVLNMARLYSEAGRSEARGRGAERHSGG